MKHSYHFIFSKVERSFIIIIYKQCRILNKENYLYNRLLKLFFFIHKLMLYYIRGYTFEYIYGT